MTRDEFEYYYEVVEKSLIAKLEYSNIVAVYDVGSTRRFEFEIHGRHNKNSSWTLNYFFQLLVEVVIEKI